MKLNCEQLEPRNMLSADLLIGQWSLIDDPEVTDGWVYRENHPSAKGGDFYYSRPGDTDETAQWHFDDLPVGTYRVLAWWHPHSNRATDAVFEIEGGLWEKNTVRNQTVGTPRWNTLASGYAVSGGNIDITLRGDDKGYVIADRIAVQRMTDYVITDWPETSDDWISYRDPYKRGLHYRNTLDVYRGVVPELDAAVWTVPDLPQGDYYIAAWWLPRSKLAKVTYDIGGDLQVVANQRYGRTEFHTLTNRYHHDGGDLEISLYGGEAGQQVFADGIMVEALPDKSGFDLQVVFPDTSIPYLRQILIEQGAQRWEQIIKGDVPDITSGLYKGIDDLQVKVTAKPIDGYNRVWAQASATHSRGSRGLPYFGYMQIDTRDLYHIGGKLKHLAIHEFGHNLGFGSGSAWHNLPLKSGGRYVGENAVKAYNQMYGRNATSLPLDSHRHHWVEAGVFKYDIMSPYLYSGQFKLSKITIGVMEDLGYTVSYSTADKLT